MKKISFLSIFLFLIIISCSSPDYTVTDIKMSEEETEVEEEIIEPLEPTGEELLYNGTAIMKTNDPRIPFILFNKEGATSAAIDENLDGEMDKVVLTDGEAKTVIEINIETGLPKKMYTSEGILVIYDFKENNSLLDVAIVAANEETIYIDNVDISTLEFTSKSDNANKTIACAPIQKSMVTMANGYKWALGGWCKIKEDNSIVFQSLDLTAKECRDIYRQMHPCCQVSAYEDIYCKQLTNQSKVLSEIEQLVACALDGDLSDCINSSTTDIQNLINEALFLKSEIGEETILQAEIILFDLIETNPGGNNNLIGTWLLERQEEQFEGIVDVTIVGVEYCDDFPNENSCYTITTETTLVFNKDGSFVSTLNELDKQEGPNGPINEIIEKEFGEWSYNTETNELLIAAKSYEYQENGVVVETDIYANGGDIIYNESFTVSETELIIIFDTEDNNADGIPEESYTEYYVRN